MRVPYTFFMETHLHHNLATPHTLYIPVHDRYRCNVRQHSKIHLINFKPVLNPGIIVSSMIVTVAPQKCIDDTIMDWLGIINVVCADANLCYEGTVFHKTSFNTSGSKPVKETKCYRPAISVSGRR